MSTVADLSSAIRGVSYAARAAKMAQLINTIYNAATTASSAASAGIAPLTGISAVATMPALAMLAGTLMQAAAAKNAQRTTQGRIKQLQEVEGIGNAVTRQGVGAKNVDELKQFLDTEQYGSRVGDLLYDLAQKNLTGFYMEGRHDRGGTMWAPNEKLQSLASGLQRMGYGQQPVKDPTGLLMSGGGFTDNNAARRTPQQRNVPEGIQNWNRTLEALSSRFPTATFAGTRPKEEVIQHYADTLFPSIRDLSMFVQGDPSQIKYAQPGGNLPMPEIYKRAQEKYGYTDQNIYDDWAQWQRELESMNRMETSGA